mmetsp:Transcript_90032/g.280218  ORF Transcript_90032/g.280218 Transcript_90032/m.280218 type:complete len:217 (+) Transcript_90032:612-1262(+)
MPASTRPSTAASKAPLSPGGFVQAGGSARTSEASRPSLSARGTSARVRRCASAASKPSACRRIRRSSAKTASSADLSLSFSSAPAAALSLASWAAENAALAAFTSRSAAAKEASLVTVSSFAAARAVSASATWPERPCPVCSAPAASASASSAAAWSFARTLSSASANQETSVTWCSCRSSAGVPKQLGATAASRARHSSGRLSAWPIPSRTAAKL